VQQGAVLCQGCCTEEVRAAAVVGLSSVATCEFYLYDDRIGRTGTEHCRASLCLYTQDSGNRLTRTAVRKLEDDVQMHELHVLSRSDVVCRMIGAALPTVPAGVVRLIAEYMYLSALYRVDYPTMPKRG
jgi:hypothetical protein